MCSYNVLTLNENGYITCCKHCHRFQLGFGTIVLILTADLFNGFCLDVQENADYYIDNGFPEQKSIHLSTFQDDVYMVVNYNELVKLYEMTEEAMLMREVYETLDLRHT